MKKSVLISFVLVVLGAGVVAYARYATLSSDTVPVKIEQRLREKAQAGKAYCDKNEYNTNYCFLVDFSIHSGKRRFFVWDFKGDSVKYASLCAHGYGKNSTLSKPVFSNVEGSYCSSLGKCFQTVYRVTFLYSDAGNGGVSFASSIRNQSRVSCDI